MLIRYLVQGTNQGNKLLFNRLLVIHNTEQFTTKCKHRSVFRNIQGGVLKSHFSFPTSTTQQQYLPSTSKQMVSIKSHWWDIFMMMVINPLKIVPTFNHDTIHHHQPFFVTGWLLKLMCSDKKITEKPLFYGSHLIKHQPRTFKKDENTIMSMV